MKAGAHRTARALTLLGTLSLAAGCAVPGFRGDSSDAIPDADMIAQNLVFTLSQVPSLHPLQTTLQVSEPSTAFGKRVLARLEDAGYGMQQVAADQGPHFVRYRTEHAESETGERRIYSVSIGDVTVERDFESSQGATLPGSAQMVSGISGTSLKTNDTIFETDVPQPFVKVAFASADEPVIRDMRLAAMRPVQPGIGAANGAAGETESEKGELHLVSGFGSSVKRNMEEMMRSNYAEIFAEYEDIQSDVLTFPNDSLHLGEENKDLILGYVSELDPATDILSVIGCSHGNTAINNGNELLAIGRANRVKEAFMFAGIEHDQVLDESCWAGDYHDGFPRRGVILTLKRKRELG